MFDSSLHPLSLTVSQFSIHSPVNNKAIFRPLGDSVTWENRKNWHLAWGCRKVGRVITFPGARTSSLASYTDSRFSCHSTSSLQAIADKGPLASRLPNVQTYSSGLQPTHRYLNLHPPACPSSDSFPSSSMSLSADPLGKTSKYHASDGVSGGWAQSLVATSSPFCSLDLLLALLVTHFTEEQVG